jgi:hypothetical protein
MRQPPPGWPACSTPFRQLAFLGILGLYSLYLLHTGIVALMKPAPDKAVLYTIAVIVCAIIVWIVIFGITALLFGV